jgi:NAD(P)-dependent dehydrogenase (short-subunit alcohol dehydrogenase family)
MDTRGPTGPASSKTLKKPHRFSGTEEWQAFIDVNLTGVFYCTREALKK